MLSLPLLFIVSNPLLNKVGTKTTPIHRAFEQENSEAFNTMFDLLADQNYHCVTMQLLDLMTEIIEDGSPQVQNFFDSGMYVTDQFADSYLVDWEEGGEIIAPIKSAYVSQDTLNKAVGVPLSEDGT